MLILLWFLVIVLAALVVAGPKRCYWTLRAPFLKNPEANEPSDMAYGMSRMVSIGALVVVGVIAVGLSVDAVQPYDERDVYQTSSDAVRMMEDAVDEGGLFSGSEDGVQRALDEAGRKGKLQATQVREDDDTTYFEVTNENGDHPHCLEITEDYELGEWDDRSLSGMVTSGECGA